MKRLIVALALLTTPLHAETRRVPNEAVIRKLCPDPRGHCLVRNPDLYKESDPKLSRRLTKGVPDASK